MKTIEDFFIPHRAESATLNAHVPGDVAFVSNKSGSNGVVSYVTPSKEDRIFEFMGIVVSALSGFTIQIPPFIARGNAGSGLIVLEPRNPMTIGQLWFVAVYLNRTASWRFNWYHQLTVDRIKQLTLPDTIPDEGKRPRVASLMPAKVFPLPTPCLQMKKFPLDALFSPHRAKSGLFSDYETGTVAYVGNGFADNGVAGYVEPLPDDKVFQFQAVVVSAFCEATVQMPPFVACSRAGNGLVVLEPKHGIQWPLLFWVAAQINRAHQWRFNWYRQVTIDRIRGLTVDVPADGLAVDMASTSSVVSTLPYWSFLKQTLRLDFRYNRPTFGTEDTYNTKPLSGEGDRG